jgi:hypothetical protein
MYVCIVPLSNCLFHSCNKLLIQHSLIVITTNSTQSIPNNFTQCTVSADKLPFYKPQLRSTQNKLNQHTLYIHYKIKIQNYLWNASEISTVYIGKQSAKYKPNATLHTHTTIYNVRNQQLNCLFVLKSIKRSFHRTNYFSPRTYMQNFLLNLTDKSFEKSAYSVYITTKTSLSTRTNCLYRCSLNKTDLLPQ